jgi:RecJ-like exonuclease
MNDVKRPGDEVSPGTGQTGEAICPECKGAGEVKPASGKAEACKACGGSGKIIALVGDA